MTVLSHPNNPIVSGALALARQWCAGHVIDGRPALGHAVRVAIALDKYVPNADPQLIAAVILHDSPDYAPADIDLDQLLAQRCGPGAVHIVRGLQREHIALDQNPAPDVSTEDQWVLWASAADKIVSLRSILRRGQQAIDPCVYWQRRQPFINRIPYFAAFHAAAQPHLPLGMADELGHLVASADRVTDPFRLDPGVPCSQDRCRRWAR
jgi:hypothetical protein